MTDPVRYGILGAANIARQFIRGCAGSPLVDVVAVASRGQDKADAFAKEMGVPRALGSYEALLADPEVEAIYIPLPNDLHAEWAIRAAAAGKHILCEKPIAIGEADGRRMYEAARKHGVKFAEAYPYMSQPQTLRMRALLAEGALGQVQTVTSSFGFSLTSADGAPLGDPANIRLDPARGGGGLLDAGTYAMSLIRLAVGERPTRVHATARMTQGGVDQTVAATIEFPGGALGLMSSCISAAGHRTAFIAGTKGVMETGYSNHAMPNTTTLPLRLRRVVAQTEPFETIEVEAGDGFRYEAESFSRMVRLGDEHWNGASEAESLDTAAALEAIAESIRTKDWVKLPA